MKGDKSFIPFRQLGQYEDIEIGLYYNRFRYYNHDTGVYISQDPIELLGNNPNFYGYVHDANAMVDPFGLDEYFFRTISKEHAEILEKTKILPATTETFTSPTAAFSSNYDGVTYKFTMKDGTTDSLAKIGVKDQSKLVKSTYPDMPEVKSGWNQDSAYFKQEKVGKKAQINIGLGQGKGLDTLNSNIMSFEKVKIECK